MEEKDLRLLLEKTEDKLSIFGNKNELIKYNLRNIDLVNLVKEFLNDEQKQKIFEFEHFKKINGNIKLAIIESIFDDKVKLNMFSKPEIISNFKSNHVISFINSLKDENKIKMLKNVDELKKFNIKGNEKYALNEIIKSFNDEYTKIEMIELYKIKNNDMIDILKTFSVESKKEILINDKFCLDNYDIQKIVESFDVENVIEFFKENNKFLEEKGIKEYEIVANFNDEKQLEFVSRLEENNLSVAKNKEILVYLNKNTKEKLDKSNFSKEYIDVIEINIQQDNSTKSFGKIEIDFKNDLEKYSDLDNHIYINPLKLCNEEREKIYKLIEICPNIRISDDLNLRSVTANEYIEGEKWMNSVLEGMDKDWNTLQKVAYIDNQIGKKISYSPDFDTEVFDEGKSRNVWDIVNSGYGICNGISQLEYYMLDKACIESEIISSGKHSFLKLKNINVFDEETKECFMGDTILDPTWNLTANRYGARPINFCRSYEKIRENDIDEYGMDFNSHKNDEELKSANLEIDEKSLRKIYSSIGVADENGDFPIKSIIEEAEKIDNLNLDEEEKLKKQFELLYKCNPEFATFQNSTITILKDVFLSQENFKFKKAVVDRVYNKNDEDRNSVMYIYLDLPNSGKNFYCASKGEKCFNHLSQKEFEEKFACYDKDLENTDGIKPWDDIKLIENTEFDEKSYEVADEVGGER